MLYLHLLIELVSPNKYWRVLKFPSHFKRSNSRIIIFMKTLQKSEQKKKDCIFQKR